MSKVRGQRRKGTIPIQVKDNPIPIDGWFVTNPTPALEQIPLFALVPFTPPQTEDQTMSNKKKGKKGGSKGKQGKKMNAQKKANAKNRNAKSAARAQKAGKSPAQMGQSVQDAKAKKPKQAKPAPSKSRNAAKERAAKERAPSKSSTPKKPSNKGKKARKSANPPRKTGLRDAQGKYLRVGDRVRTVEGIDRQFARPGDVVARFGTITKRDPRGLVVVSWDGKDGKYSTRNPKNLVYAAPYRSNPDESGVGAVFKFAGSALGSFGVSGLLHAGLRAVADRMMGRQNVSPLVDTAIGATSMLVTGGVGYAIEGTRKHFGGILAGLMLRLTAHVGRSLSNAPVMLKQFTGSLPTSQLAGLYDLDELDDLAGPSFDVWEPAGLLT